MAEFGQRVIAAADAAKEVSGALNPSLSPDEKLAEQSLLRTRIPMSAPKAKLNTPEIPGFHLHWLNDEGSRISQAIAGGYAFVTPGETLITSTDLAGEPLGEGSDLGTRVSIVVGKHEGGAPMRAYLMKIPNEYYAEDQASTQDKVDRIHDAMQQGKQQINGDTPGDVAKRYVARSSMKSTYSRRSA